MGTVMVRCCRLSAAPLTPFLEAGAVSTESMLLAKPGSLGRWYQCGFSPCSSCYCSGVRVCGGEVGSAFCPFPSVSGFHGSVCDAHGEDGMILGLLVVPHAITLYLEMGFYKTHLRFFFFCHCAFPEFLRRAAWNFGLPQCLPLQ